MDGDKVRMPTDDEPIVIIHGDAVTVLRQLPAASIHCSVADPPSALGVMGLSWDSLAGYQARTDLGAATLARLSASSLPARVMVLLRERLTATILETLRECDVDLDEVWARGVALAAVADQGLLEPWEAGYVAFLVDVWLEARRVLMPAGVVCAWAHPRTADLAALALRIAGYDVFDSLLHLFGTGTSKGERIGQRLAETDQELGARWDDYNTQLASGHEVWMLARAAREPGLTFSQHAARYGTGALNIGAVRVPRTPRDREKAEAAATQGTGIYASEHTYGDAPRTKYVMNAAGSYPSNVALTHSADCTPERCETNCPCAVLDRQSGWQQDRTATKRPKTGAFDSGDRTQPTVASVCYGGEGGCSRFFTQLDSKVGYWPKPKDRGIPDRAGAKVEHKTWKGRDLMHWLVSAVAPIAASTPGGPIVLDWCAGSGGTLVACASLGLRAIGIEIDAEHVATARLRIGCAQGDAQAASDANLRAAPGSQMVLF